MLSDRKIKNVKTQKLLKLADGEGLYLYVRPSGTKTWMFRLRQDGKDKMISIGRYPAFGLSEAREKAEDIKLQTQRGFNLQDIKDKTPENTFEVWAERWYQHWAVSVSERVQKQGRRRLVKYIYPTLEGRKLEEITKQHIREPTLKCLHAGHNSEARYVFNFVSNILSYAVEHEDQSGLKYNLAKNLRVKTLVPSVPVIHRARVTSDKLPELAEDVAKYKGNRPTILAIQLLMHLFVRVGELVRGTWSEVDFEEKVWRIPAERMKKRTDHLVPLSSQVLNILLELKSLPNKTDYIIPGRGRKKPMCSNTPLYALIRMGYQGKQTAHGFRGIARTKLGEMGYERVWLETQLAHLSGDATERSYNSALYLKQRRKMMQDWSNYLENLKVKK